MVKQNKLVIDFINKPTEYYLDKDGNMCIGNNPNITYADAAFVKVGQITFEEEAPRKEAIENVLSALRFPGVNTVFIIKGSHNNVAFYYGVVKNKVFDTGVDESTINAIGNSILKRCIEGNFRGSRVNVVSNDETSELINTLNTYKCLSSISGVPGINADESANFQGVDRLVDTMLGDDFMFVVTATHLSLQAINAIEGSVYGFYDSLVPVSKNSEQHNTSVSQGTSTTKGQSNSIQNSKQESDTTGTNKGTSRGKTKDNSTETGNEGSSSSKTLSETKSTTNGTSESQGENQSKSSGKTFSFEHSNKQAQDWLKYIDETLLPRLDYGKGKGLFVVGITLFANNELVQQKLENTATSLFSGEKGNKAPLITIRINNDDQKYCNIRALQIPVAYFRDVIEDNEIMVRAALSQYATNNKIYLGNWMSVKELGIIAGLPRKEVMGLTLREEVEFGLNYPDGELEEKEKINLGNIVHGGVVKNDLNVSLSKKTLNKHIFVCGVTGCGKTTTCMGLLQKCNMPFLVIEPAKTEYRIMAKHDPTVLVFTLGRDDIAPFRFNPLEFLPNETISSHVDMVKASIEAAFDMEAAIPQIIEAALYKCYEVYGWDIYTNTNNKFADPFADGVYAFPTLGDLMNIVPVIVDEQGFDERLKNDYIGSIKARLQGLLVGAKGNMLNTQRSINFTDIVNKKVILELEEIKSGTEKSLIMGFILTCLCEAIKHEYKKNKEFCHISLIEEAHRLLSKYVPGDSLSKKNGVETFSDMLAEVRKYGEGLIIADQIPEKMAPDVLKNTNTKIVHKIFAQDDKEAIGNTMSLTDEQKRFLSSLSTGRAVVFTQGWEKSIQVQIDKLLDTTDEFIDERRIRALTLNYYVNNYKNGVFPEIQCMTNMPSVSKFEEILSYMPLFRQIKKSFLEMLHKKADGDTMDFKGIYSQLKKSLSMEEIANYINNTCLKTPSDDTYRFIAEILECIDCGMLKVKTEENLVKYKKMFNPNLFKKL